MSSASGWGRRRPAISQRDDVGGSVLPGVASDLFHHILENEQSSRDVRQVVDIMARYFQR